MCNWRRQLRRRATSTAGSISVGQKWLPGTDYSRYALTPAGVALKGDRHRRFVSLSSNHLVFGRRFELGASSNFNRWEY